jgi:hypothetical protein
MICPVGIAKSCGKYSVISKPKISGVDKRQASVVNPVIDIERVMLLRACIPSAPVGPFKVMIYERLFVHG